MTDSMGDGSAASPQSERPPKRTISRGRRALFIVIALALGLLAAGLLCEATFRVLARVASADEIREGTGASSEPDPRWGWRPVQGSFRLATREFDSTGHVNSLYMNDDPYDPQADGSRTRILVLSDSHTFPVGASVDESWAKRLERGLGEVYAPHEFRCYNASAPGYSMHQYLVRLIDQGPLLEPHYVVVGLSYATDLYDLLPPDHGGWMSGPGLQMARDYFDLDDNGTLVERRWDPDDVAPEQQAGRRNVARAVRSVLSNLATFRYLRRSSLALFVGSKVKLGGQSLWPNMEVVVEREIAPGHEYGWRLFCALLERIQQESRALGAELIVVGIPYLPQVYDEIWQQTFGGDSRFSPTAANERVRAFCEEQGIVYIETLDALRDAHEQTGRWMHHRRDAHPTPEGHEVIARTVLEAEVFVPRAKQ